MVDPFIAAHDCGGCMLTQEIHSRGRSSRPTTTDTVSMIRAGAPVMTLINVFTVEPSRQQELVDLLVEATEATMRHKRGFISANIHRSADGKQVVNYAQWRTPEDFTAMRDDPDASAHMTKAAAIAQFFPIICEVVYVDHA
jgi:quinol monooxygenase YgiN